MTLNDLERRNGRYLAFFTEFGSLGPITSKGSKIDLCSLQQECSPKNLVFSDDDIRRDYLERPHYRQAPARYTSIVDYDASESQSTLSVWSK